MRFPWLAKLITKFIVWDLDGTLYHNEQLGIDIRKYFFNRLKKELPTLTDKKFEELTHTYCSWSAVVSHYTNQNEFTVLDEFDRKVNRSRYLSSDPKIVDLIENKLSKYHHLILTNSGLEETKKCLQKIGFSSQTFEIIFARDTTKMLKPDPNIYPIIKHHTKTANIRHLFIGDSMAHDILPPLKLGFQALPIWEVDHFFS